MHIWKVILQKSFGCCLSGAPLIILSSYRVCAFQKGIINTFGWYTHMQEFSLFYDCGEEIIILLNGILRKNY